MTDGMAAFMRGAMSAKTAIGHVVEASEGISEALPRVTASRRPPEAGRGSRGASAPSDGCPCVGCPDSRDCGDDFYCVQFERWFAAQSEERW